MIRDIQKKNLENIEIKKRKLLQKKYDDDFVHTAIPYKTDHLNRMT
jgi:hypothetical protein